MRLGGRFDAVGRLAGAGAGAGAGEGEVEGGTRPGLEVDLQNPDLLTTLAYQLHKWEGQFNLLVEKILQDLKDYWMRLSIPQ